MFFPGAMLNFKVQLKLWYFHPSKPTQYSTSWIRGLSGINPRIQHIQHFGRPNKMHQMSHEENPPTFHNTSCLIGIMVYQNPPLYSPTNRSVFHCSNGYAKLPRSTPTWPSITKCHQFAPPPVVQNSSDHREIRPHWSWIFTFSQPVLKSLKDLGSSHVFFSHKKKTWSHEVVIQKHPRQKQQYLFINLNEGRLWKKQTGLAFGLCFCWQRTRKKR